MARKFKADLRRNAICTACQTEYYYFHTLELNEYDSEKFDAKVRDAVENGVGVAPCPACGKLNAEMRAAHNKALLGHMGGLAVGIAILLFCWMMAVQGALFYILAPVGALVVLGYLIAISDWLLVLIAPGTKRKHSIIPGREAEASDEARKKLAAWAAKGPLG
ncbi:hypothetical protein ACWCOP_00375 [Maricaulaceae bacterium MS644]